ncbi:unnamed protein product [Hymenolepis diminuta]|uniref:Uncharacterized protein n=1 Tax=Hymenolepis diminuta TaxID=6216 RepID=A0A564Z8F6_HYMDI|nr:unnamed protein product [Hymenolepis diminuta]
MYIHPILVLDTPLKILYNFPLLHSSPHPKILLSLLHYLARLVTNSRALLRSKSYVLDWPIMYNN